MHTALTDGTEPSSLTLETLQKTWRRQLHQIPELELDLPETAAYLKEQLKDMNCQVIEPEGCGSSFLAYFDFGKEKSVAFRSDMDALPVSEKTAVSFASRHEGKMHACGHDGHMANLLGLAWKLSKKAENPYNVLLIFQAGEESPGGAKLLCDQNIFQEYAVQAVYGLHLWPALPKGVVAVRPGAMMARTTEIDVVIHGKSAHAAKYKEGIDAMQIGAEMLLQMYAMEQALDPSVYRLLRFGSMTAGTVRNAVAKEARLCGTLRAFDDKIFDGLCKGIEEIAKKLEAQYGCSIEITCSNGYPPVINDEALSQRILANFETIKELPDPQMIAEDFAFYQKECPGVFFFLGTGTGIALHADTFDFDESLLASGTDFFEKLASFPTEGESAS